MHSAAKWKPPRGLDGAAGKETTELVNVYPNDSQIASAVRDTKDGPWCWQSKHVLRFIRDCFDDTNTVSSAIAIYTSLTEIASDHQSETFTCTIREIASKAGTSYRTATSVLKRFERLGVVAIQRNTIAGSKENAPSTYSLLRLGNERKHGSLPRSESS